MKINRSPRPPRIRPGNLFVFIAAALAFLALPYRAATQIRYVDIDPDTTLVKGGTYNLDADGDGNADFEFALSDTPPAQSDIITCLQDSSFVAYEMVEVCYTVLALERYDTIETSRFDYTIKPNYYRLYFWGLDYCMHPGWFGGTTDKFVGLKMIRGGKTWYGWVRIDVAPDGTWVRLKDYATGGADILAGQAISGVDDNRISRMLTVRNNDNAIVISPSRNLQLTDACLINTVQQQLTLPVTANHVIIPKSSLPPGLYLVRLSTSEGNCTVKVIINR